MRGAILALVLILPIAGGGCQALERAKVAAVTPAPELGGKTPLQVLVTASPELAAAIAAGNVPAAIQKGSSIWESLGLILAGALGGGGVVAVKRKSSTKVKAKAKLKPKEAL